MSRSKNWGNCWQMGLPGPRSLNLSPRAPTSLQKSLRQFLSGHEFVARVLWHETHRPGALAGVPLPPKRPKPNPDGTPAHGPRPTLGEGAPGSAWGRAGSPAPWNALSAPRNPPTQPSPG